VELLQGMTQAFGRKSSEEAICSNLPLPMDEQVRNCIGQFLEANSMSPRILNRDLRPVFENAFVSPPYSPLSNLCISEIRYALDIYHQFTILAYAVFSRNDRGLPMPTGDIEDTIDVILSQNGPFKAIRD
jgi:hypothetical protein